jgi:NAD(P)-dependent dehydrogenase (short-subunit alcohol dehydrogenase family)
MKKVWFITGSSRGLGRCLTEALLANGQLVAASARHPEELNDLVRKYRSQIFTIKLDVTRNDEVFQVVADTVAYFGKIDVLVNNAGFGVTGAAEAFSEEQLRSQLDTNLYAPIEITRAVLPYMRKQRSGHILQISSIGGRVGNAGLSIYQAAKFGLSGFSESLSKEVAPLGIRVTCIEPGGFRTDWAGASMTYATRVEGYESTVDLRADIFKRGKYVPMGDPDKAANVIIELVEHPFPPVHLILGSDAAGMLKRADAERSAEFEKWLPVSLSTDSDDAVNIIESKELRTLLEMKGNG